LVILAEQRAEMNHATTVFKRARVQQKFQENEKHNRVAGSSLSWEVEKGKSVSVRRPPERPRECWGDFAPA